MFLENSPFLTAFELSSFAVLPSVDGIAEGGHFSASVFRLFFLFFLSFLLASLLSLVYAG